MEGLGKDGSFCMPRPFAWLNLTENEASSRLWKLSDCFSPFAQTAPVEKKQKDFMDSRQTMLELKDTPTVPPLLPPFPLSSLPRPSVSMCNHCEPGTMALGGGGGDVGVPHLVATSQPLSCCSGTLRPPHSFTCSQPKLLPPAPGDPCLGSLALYPCPGLSSSSLIPHLSMEHRVCVKDAHYCRVCVRKSARGDSKSLWPNIPPPSAQSAPVPVPMCNGCGVSGATADGFVLMGTGFGISNHKYGSPESSRDENLPPVGVFWDIENCSVPSGRSAVAVVQRIRSRFFKGHREAEFICVCDISKESKEVIQELNNCQVTVAHINATAKNAADDKLRQSLRRFADTHAAPATVVLVSYINFASELSDLRHRHGFQVILVHKNQASEALLQHAHQHVAFEDFVSDLPTRMPLKQQPASTLLYVYNLPTNRDSKSVSNRLRRLSDNCGGKVLSVTAGCAVLRFSSQEACQRAAKRMEGEDVFGSHIAVSFRPRAKAGQSGAPDPVQELCSLENKPRMPVQLEKKVRNNDVALTLNSFEPAKLVTADIGHRGRRRECSTSRSVTDSPVDRSDFHVSTPSAFSKLCLQKTFSPLVLSQGSWSPRSGSPCLSSRSSPLTAPPRSPCLDGTYEPFSDGVDIQVSNMDYRMSRKELQQTLLDTFSKHGRVKSVELSPHTDYQLKATVQMCALQQAISAVSNLHRYKIGSKRIHVSLVTTGNRSLGPLSSEVISILQDAPACCLPLFKLAEIYEKKFGRRLPLGDLYKLTEVVSLRDQGSTRLVCLLPSSQARQSPLGSSQSHDGSSTSGSPVVFEELEYHEPVCRQHHATQIFSESDFDPDSYQIPFVVLSLKAFAAQVHSLLQSHEGTVPLLSFPDCYAAEFTPLVLGEEGQVEGGIPLEHLITCVPGINIVTAQNGYKVIKWIHNKPPQPNVDPWSQRCKSPVGNPQLIQFSREVIDLLKSQPCCIMPVNKFIPSYHHHFAKQCRVSDYGYSKLLELLEAVPHVLQILGMGSKRLLTLTHRTQVKRFTQDLLKLLKFQVSKQVDTKDFMQAYHWCFSRDWKVVEYGMCDLLDLLAEIPDTTITITQQDTQTVISIPKRERTSEEMERTKQFAKEVVDLLRHQPHFRMPFSKFIPSYHHHFGRQCKLSYYGFTKLMELFEAIPDVLQVLECGEEKILTLTEMEKVKALAAQMVKLLRSQKDSSMPLSHFLSEYNKTFGYGLRLQDYDVSSVPALLHKLCHVVKVADGPGGRDIQLISRKSLRSLTTQLLALLMSMPAEQDWLTVEELSQQYESTHGLSLNPCHYGFVSLSELLKSLPYLVQLHEKETNDRSERVQLTQLYQFARSVRALLHTYHYNQIFLNEFPIAFCKYTGTALQPRTYGYNTLDELLAAIPQVVWIKGHAHKKIIVLKNDMKARVSPHPDGESCDAQAEDEMSPLTVENTLLEGESCTAELEETELLTLSSPVDLLCGPVPSCLPSPQLHPDPVLLQQADLIRFEPSTPPLKPSLADSPGRRRGRVKLAANFSLAPVTQL